MMANAAWSTALDRRRFLGLAGSGAAALGLAACSSSGSGASNTPKSTGNVLFHARVGSQGTFYSKSAAAFNAASTTGKVNAQNIPASTTTDYLQKVSTLISGGNAGDAMWTASVYNFFQYANAGVWADLTSFVAQDHYDMSVYFPNSVNGATLKGRLYGLPVDAHPGRAGLYYNKTAFQAVNLPLPTADWTYDDLHSAAKELTKTANGKTTQFGFLPGSEPYYDLIIPIRSYGGDWMNSAGTKATIRGATLDGLRAYLSVFQKGVSPTSGAQADFGFGELFTLGRAAMWETGYWGIGTITSQNPKFEWGVVPMPKGPAGLHSMLEFDADVILAKSKSAETAWQYLKACSTTNEGISLGKLSVPGARPDVWKSSQLAAVQGHTVWSNDILPTAGPLLVPRNSRFVELAATVQNSLGPVYAGAKSVDDVASDLESAINGVLNEPPIS